MARGGRAIRHVHDVGLGHQLEHLHADVELRADTGRGVVELAGIGFDERDQFLEVAGLHRRIADQHQRQPGNHADRREIAEWIVGQVAVEMRIDRHRRVHHHHQRVAVGCCLGELPGRDAAVSGRLVVDDHRLMHRRRESIGDGPRHEVQSATRCGGDHDLDRLRRIVILRVRRSCRKQCHAERQYDNGVLKFTVHGHNPVFRSHSHPSFRGAGVKPASRGSITNVRRYGFRSFTFALAE